MKSLPNPRGPVKPFLDPHGYSGGKPCWLPGSLTPSYADEEQVGHAWIDNDRAFRRRKIPDAIEGYEDILCWNCRRVVPLGAQDPRAGIECGLPMFNLSRLTMCRQCGESQWYRLTP